MLSLKDKFHLKKNEELIEIVESQDSYTLEAIDFAAEILNERFLTIEEIKLMAEDFWNRTLEKSLKEYLKKGTPPKSNFLSEDELKKIFAKQYQAYVDKKELMAVDSSIYWFVF